MKLDRLAARIFNYQQKKAPEAVLISTPRDVHARAGNGPPQRVQRERQERDPKYAFHTVPYIRQEHINMCADACINMLVAYHGIAPNSLAKNPRGVMEGLDTDQVQEELRKNGLVPYAVELPTDSTRGWSADSLAAAIAKNGPMICTVKLPGGAGYHSVLLVGSSGDTVVFHDPWRGPKQTLALEKFNKSLNWDDDDAMLASKRPAQRRAELPTGATTQVSSASPAHRSLADLMHAERPSALTAEYARRARTPGELPARRSLADLMHAERPSALTAEYARRARTPGE